MAQRNFKIFISYRRDDAAGYAGRLEDSIERRLGRGVAFRDVGDIAPGQDFAQAIHAGLAGARAVLVLIGPRWAGGDTPGSRRIDRDDDFVRLEVQAALTTGAKVVPVLLPGTDMPTEDELPPPLKALVRHQALALDDTHWDAEIERLLAGLGLSPSPAHGPWLRRAAVLGAAALAAGLLGLWWQQRPAPAVDTSSLLLGRWQAEVRYNWGDRASETFVFERHAGAITGTASFLRYPRGIEELQFDGTNLHFSTRTRQTMGSEERELKHAYSAELRGQPPQQVLVFRMLSSGGFGSYTPLSFEARRVETEPAKPKP